jgi:hypothetical protein
MLRIYTLSVNLYYEMILRNSTLLELIIYMPATVCHNCLVPSKHTSVTAQILALVDLMFPLD